MREVLQWTYGAAPATSDKDAVRFYIGDVDDRDKQLDDREIAFMLQENGAPLEAAIAGCLFLAAHYARDYDESTGKTSAARGNIYQHYLDLAEQLKARRGVSSGAIPYAGGLSIAGKVAQENDPDRVAPAFKKDLHDAPASRIDPIQRTTNP